VHCIGKEQVHIIVVQSVGWEVLWGWQNHGYCLLEQRKWTEVVGGGSSR